MANGHVFINAKMQVHNYVTLWRVLRVDGVAEYYTDHDENLELTVIDATVTDVNGIDTSATVWFSATFLATAGLSMSATRQETGMRASNRSATGVIDGLSEADLAGGRYDMAEIIEWHVDARWPWMPWFRRKIWWVGAVKYSDSVFTFEIEGPERRAQENVGSPFFRSCRYSLGRNRDGVAGKGCGTDRSSQGGQNITLANITYVGVVVSHVAQETGSNARQSFNLTTTATLLADQLYKYGRVIWTSGANAGLSYDIGDFNPAFTPAGSTGQFSTNVLMQAAVQVGDTCTIEEGCDGTYETCDKLRLNSLNFGGYPYIPGPTRAHQAPRKNS